MNHDHCSGCGKKLAPFEGYTNLNTRKSLCGSCYDEQGIERSGEISIWRARL